MGKVIADMSMSLDGFIADPHDAVGALFDWFEDGEETFTFPGDGREARVSAPSAEHLRGMLARVGAVVCGRRLYEVARGWGGSHPVGAPVFVVTHSPPDSAPAGSTPLTFVTDGVRSAIAQAQSCAGERDVAVASASIASQCLDAGLLDRIQVSLVPVLLGGGIPFFAHLRQAPVMLGDPRVIPGTRVTHLYYDVRR